MSRTLQVITTVLPGHRIEIESPELPEGQSATVLIILRGGELPKRPFWEIIGDYAGGGLFRTADEVDAYLREERNSWE